MEQARRYLSHMIKRCLIVLAALLFIIPLSNNLLAAHPGQGKSSSGDETVSEWLVFMYVQAQNNLESYAHKNIADIGTTGSNKNIKFVVQWFQPGKKGIWRYRVDKDQTVLEMSQPSDTDGNKASDLVDAVRWAVNKYPSKKVALILWNHGLGIIDPIWGNHRPPFALPTSFSMNSSFVKNNPRISIEGLTTGELEAVADLIQEHDEILAAEESDENAARSILFNEHSKTYMDNQNLCKALSDIKRDVLGNRKIDLLGMDACLMAMTEVAYMVRDYAKVFVGSQEVELANGWAYGPLAKDLATGSLSPGQLGINIVKNYEQYYKDKIQFYTQSAIDLTKMTELKKCIDMLAQTVKGLRNNDNLLALDCIRQARRECLQFSASSYIDLFDFCKKLAGAAERCMVKRQGNVSVLSVIRQQAQAVMQAVEVSILCNTSGKNLTDAHGLSIYFPLHHIDSSYHKTDFVADTSWLDLIRSNLH